MPLDTTFKVTLSKIAAFFRWSWIHIKKGFKIENLKQYLLFHLKELILCFILAYLLTQIDKIQHFFNTFADILTEGNSYATFWSIIGNMFMITWLCMVCWHRPLDIVKGSFNKYYLQAGGNIFLISLVSSIPLLFFNSSLVLALFHHKITGIDNPIIEGEPLRLFQKGGLCFVLAIFVYFLIAAFIRLIVNWLREHSPAVERMRVLKFCADAIVPERGNYTTKKNYFSTKNVFRFLMMIVLLSPILFLSFYHVINQDGWKPILYVGLFLFVFTPPLALSYFLYNFTRLLILQEEKKKTPTGYKVILISSYLLSVSLFLCFNIRCISSSTLFLSIFFPLSTLIFVFIFYYQIIDFLYYNFRNIGVKLISATLILCLLLAAFHQQKEHYKLDGLDTVTSVEPANRATLEYYFKQWLLERYEQNLADSLTIYLVAAEGGGSRAGAWTSTVLTKLNALDSINFARNCFAISSVSGGTFGATTSLSLWANADSIVYNDTACTSEYINKIFRRNFISGSIAGIFFYDFFQTILGVNCIYGSRSRSEHLQWEENNAVNEAFSNLSNTNTNYLKDTSFLSIYYDKNNANQLKTNLPLLLSNTCRVQDGKRGVISPVELKSQDFYDCIDILKYFPNKKDISIAEASNLSELFPYLSSTIHIDGIGTFMDGGAFENMGLTTLYELRRKLGKIIKDLQADTIADEKFKDFISRINFELVLIYAVYNHGFENKCMSDSEPNQIADPIKALLNTPFGGHTDYAYHRIMNSEYGKEVKSIYLMKQCCCKDKSEIIMSRWISEKEFDKINDRADCMIKHNFPSKIFSNKDNNCDVCHYCSECVYCPSKKCDAKKRK